MKIIYMLLQTGYSITAIYNYFNALDQNNQNALQILIDPEKNETIITCNDRYLQELLTENKNWTEMLEILKKQTF
jgi:hypothetical protein